MDQIEDSPALISVIVLGFYYNQEIITLLKLLNKDSYPNFEIVLIWSEVKKNRPIKEFLLENGVQLQKISIFSYKKNLGYALGNNIGSSKAKGQYIIILNPDVEIEENFIFRLLNTYKYLKKLKNTSKIIINPRISNQNGKVEFSRRYTNFLGFTNPDISNSEKIRRTQVLSGCGIFIRKRDFKSLGGFDAKYFMYKEDVDFSIRAIKEGYLLYVDNSHQLWHSKSDEEYKLNLHKYYYIERNRLIFSYEHASNKKKMILTQLLLEPVHWIFAFQKGIKFMKTRLKIYRDLLKIWLHQKNHHKCLIEDKTNTLFDRDYQMDGIFNEVDENKLIITILNFYSKMLFFLYHS